MNLIRISDVLAFVLAEGLRGHGGQVDWPLHYILKTSPLKCGPLALLRIEVMSHIGFSLKKLRNNGSWGVHKVYKACQLIISWIRISNSLRMSPLHWVVWNYTNWMGQLGPTWHFYSIKSGPENGPKLGQLGPAWPFYAAIFRHIATRSVSGQWFFFSFSFSIWGKLAWYIMS